MSLFDDSQQLRAAARAVAEGKLARDEYRRLRRSIIDSHAGEAPLAAHERTQPNPPVVLGSPTEPPRKAVAAAPAAEAVPANDRTRERLAPAPEQAPAARGGDIWLGVAGVGLVLLVLAGLLVLFF